MFEALEPAHAVLDAGAGLVERPCEEGRLVLLVDLEGNDGDDASRFCRRAIGLAGIAFVADDGARGNVRTDVEQSLEMGAIRLFAAGQVEGDDVARTI
jgi:hypothetical protein